MFFDELALSDEVLDALWDMHFDECTPVQEKAIPVILDRHDVIACAQTGTGKTAAYILPLLTNLAYDDHDPDKLNAIIMAPTRELAQQIDQQMEGFGYYVPFSSVPIYGGKDNGAWGTQVTGLQKGADIVIGSKRHPKSRVKYPWHRRIASSIYFSLVRFFIGIPVTDTQTGMKLFRRKTLGDALDRMLVKAYAFDLELLSIAYGRGAKIAEAPVAIKFENGFGALSFRTVKQMLMDSLAVFYRLRLLNYYAHVEVPPPLKHNPLVSVVIACPNGSWMLDECLEDLQRQTYREFEVIVLPDGELNPSKDYGSSSSSCSWW